MDSTKSAEVDAAQPIASNRFTGYFAGVGRHLLRVLVVIFVVPLVMLKAAHSISKSDAAVSVTASEPAASAALKTTLTGGGIMVGAGAWDANTWAVFGGIAIAAAGFLWQVWMGWRRDRREAREHEAKMREHAARMSELEQ